MWRGASGGAWGIGKTLGVGTSVYAWARGRESRGGRHRLVKKIFDDDLPFWKKKMTVIAG